MTRLAFILSILCASVANASTLTVTSLSDSGAGSLRQAVADASASDTVTFAITGKIALTTEITIDKSLTIAGNGQITLDGGGSTRLLNLSVPGTSISLSHLTFAHGYDGGDYGGGAILCVASLELINATFLDNSTDDGGDQRGGAVWAVQDEDLTGMTVAIQGCTFARNHSAVGGALEINLVDAVTIDDSVFNDNSARGHGAVSLGQSATTATITHSTFSNNSATVTTGALYVEHSTFVMSNCTFNGSRGGYAAVGIENDASTTFNNVTFSGGADGTADVASEGGSITLASSILGSDIGCFEGASITSDDHNIIRNGHSCTITPAAHDKVGTAAVPINPVLLALTDNGGNTKTMALGCGSPALRAAGACEAGTDQRGYDRPGQWKDDGICDVGAFETQYNPCSPSPTQTATPTITRTPTSTATQTNTPSPLPTLVVPLRFRDPLITSGRMVVQQ